MDNARQEEVCVFHNSYKTRQWMQADANPPSQDGSFLLRTKNTCLLPYQRAYLDFFRILGSHHDFPKGIVARDAPKKILTNKIVEKMESFIVSGIGYENTSKFRYVAGTFTCSAYSLYSLISDRSRGFKFQIFAKYEIVRKL